MKLRIKETGEVLEDVKTIDMTLFHNITIYYLDNGILRGHLIKNLSDVEEVKDYEEPKEYWFINDLGKVERAPSDWLCDEKESRKEIGNHFSSKEEAEKAVEKLKALTRLENNGFRFTGFEETDRGCLGDFTIYCYIKPDYTRPYNDVDDDLDLLFGGEE